MGDGSAMMDRRRLLLSALTIGGSALLAAGCRRVPDIVEQPIDFVGAARRSGDPLYSQAAAAYVAAIPAQALPQARKRWSAVTITGNLIALVEDCPVGDLPVRYCSSLQLFQCPGCSSLYNRIGERIDGPATRGLDRRPVSVDPSGQLVIDRRRRIDGPAAGEALILPVDPTLEPLASSPEVQRCRQASILPPNPRRRTEA